MKNPQNNSILRPKFIILIIIIAISLIFLIIFSTKNTSEKTSFTITNFDSCALEISQKYRTQILANILNRIKESSNKKGEPSHFFSSEIQENSCKLTDSILENRRLTTANFILNIPNLEQSYQIAFSYLRTSIKQSQTNLDLGHVKFSCPKDIQSKYHCKNQSDLTESTQNSLSLINQVISPGCSFQTTSSATSKSGINIIIIYDPPTYLYHESNNRYLSNFKTTCRNRIENTLKSANLKLSDYGFYENDRTLNNPVFKNSR